MEDLLAAIRDLRDSASRTFEKRCLSQVGHCPGNPV
jgi:hypothetical protein